MDIEQCKIIVVLTTLSVKMVFTPFNTQLQLTACVFLNGRNTDCQAGRLDKNSNDYSVIKSLLMKFFLCLERNAPK